MSQFPDLPEANDANLRRALGQLPTHEPGPEAWPRIEAQLAADAALARALPALPTHEPADTGWAAIAARLDTPAAAPGPAGPWRLRSRRRAWALVASLALLLGGWWQWQHPAAPAPREQLAFSEEIGAAPLPAPGAAAPADSLERQGQAFIEAHCAALPAGCQSGEFRALRTQLAELQNQETELRQAERRFGRRPSCCARQARLITLKANITRELVQQLIS